MRLLIVGAGGHAKVVVDAALCAGWEIAGIVDAHTDRGDLLGFPISRSADGIAAEHFLVAIGDNQARADLYSQHLALGLTPAVVAHPSAIVADSASLGGGTFVAAGVIINPEAVIGENVILNTGCIVEHDVKIGDHAHVGPGVSMCGAASAGAGALLGVGVSVKPQASIGSWCTVGAGAAVVSDLPDNSVCAGVPARPLRTTQGD